MIGAAAAVALVIVLFLATEGLIIGAHMALVPIYEMDRAAGIWVVLASFVVLVVLGVGLNQIGFFDGGGASSPDQGSCKSGHYISTGKTSSFHCDEYYPPPAVNP